jgi:hypothetical protein
MTSKNLAGNFEIQFSKAYKKQNDEKILTILSTDVG